MRTGDRPSKGLHKGSALADALCERYKVDAASKQPSGFNIPQAVECCWCETRLRLSSRRCLPCRSTWHSLHRCRGLGTVRSVRSTQGGSSDIRKQALFQVQPPAACLSRDRREHYHRLWIAKCLYQKRLVDRGLAYQLRRRFCSARASRAGILANWQASPSISDCAFGCFATYSLRYFLLCNMAVSQPEPLAVLGIRSSFFSCDARLPGARPTGRFS